MLTGLLLSSCQNELVDTSAPRANESIPPTISLPPVALDFSQFAENFDDGSLDPGMSVWNSSPAGQPPAIVDDGTALGGRSLRISWAGGADNSQGAKVAIPGGAGPAVFVRFRYRLPENASLVGFMNLIRFRGPGDKAIGSLSIANGLWSFGGEDLADSSEHPATGSTPADCLGQWCWIEASMDYSAGTAFHANVWVNGIEVLDYTRSGISYPGGIEAVEVWGGFQAPAESRSEWVDELAVGTHYQGLPPSNPVPEVYFASDFGNCSAIAQVGSLLAPAAGDEGDHVVVTNTNPYPGGQCSAEFTFGGNSDSTDDAWAEWRFQLTKPVTEAWVAWSAYYPGAGDVAKGTAPYVHRAVSPNNNKLLRLWDEDYGAYRLKLGFSLTAGALSNITTEYGTNGTGVGRFGSQYARDAISPAVLGRWIRFVAHVRTATAANNDGVIELWQDGVKVITNTTLPIYPSGGLGNYFRYGYLLGWANSGFAETTKVWLAKVVIASSQALTDSY